MFGLGKKKVNPEIPPDVVAGAVAPPPSEPKLNISDDQFIVMPEEYLPKSAPAGGAGKKFYFISGGAAIFLLVLAGILYWALIANKKPVAPPLAPPVVNNEPAPAATSTVENLKIVESQAFDSAGQLLGAIKISLPEIVANKYGQALGVTVLTAADISLPPGQAVSGGLYSVYPVGAVFERPVAVNLSATALPTPENRSNYFPAYFNGAVWQAIVATVTADGWSFNFDKFPAGPIAIVEQAAVTATSTAEAAADIAGAGKPAPSADTDGDGLTDEEEKLLGANPALADTDGDTYADRAEIFGGYSPLSAGVKLEAADLFTTYTNPTYGYKAPYPKKWLADALDQTNKQVLFISSTEEFFEILVEDNPLKKPIVDWYRAQSPALAAVELNVATVDGAAAVWSPDGLTLYIGRDGLVYIITYNKGTVEQINWPTLFEYFYKNFKFGNTATPADNSAPVAAPLAP